jgi:tellurite resistance protein
LEGAPFSLKKQLLEAGARVVQADGVVEPAEAEMLRALAASLGCPVPPG